MLDHIEYIESVSLSEESAQLVDEINKIIDVINRLEQKEDIKNFVEIEPFEIGFFTSYKTIKEKLNEIIFVVNNLIKN